MSKKKQEQKARARNRKLQTPQPKNSLLSANITASPPLHNIYPPEGFRIVPFMDALMTMAEPLRELDRDESEKATERLMSVIRDIWNFMLPNTPAHQKKLADELVEQLCDTYHLDETDAEALLDEIVERKAYLLPDDIQPGDPRILFIRKERDVQIVAIADAQITFQQSALPATPEDGAMLQQLQRLDAMLADGEDFDRWESLYFEVERACGERYFEWLKAKGVQEEYNNAFPYCIEIFLNFVYRHNAGTLEILQYHELEDFLLYHLVREVEIRPEDYVLWLPAIRFFYRFLGEKGYMREPQPMIQMVNAIESNFLKFLENTF
ncbi:hypothetical protein U14_00566 [Candidatus Moduliflexus flocculans]|uniref:Uncharacterized protein n=1 Tax=Candidatus Moduliflexus flocculans TaxID=1499966 RepID=A0A0S6VQI2_9BACT|nr:hypothetical protein U14_00566 [Candidatus Moduliflexus flocculans]